MRGRPELLTCVVDGGICTQHTALLGITKAKSASPRDDTRMSAGCSTWLRFNANVFDASTLVKSDEHRFDRMLVFE